MQPFDFLVFDKLLQHDVVWMQLNSFILVCLASGIPTGQPFNLLWSITMLLRRDVVWTQLTCFILVRVAFGIPTVQSFRLLEVFLNA